MPPKRKTSTEAIKKTPKKHQKKPIDDNISNNNDAGGAPKKKERIMAYVLSVGGGCTAVMKKPGFTELQEMVGGSITTVPGPEEKGLTLYAYDEGLYDCQLNQWEEKLGKIGFGNAPGWHLYGDLVLVGKTVEDAMKKMLSSS